MRNNSTVILIILLLLAITFGVYQTARLKKVSASDSTLKYQFLNFEKEQEKAKKQLQEAYKTITALKIENERLSKITEQKSLDEERQNAEEFKRRAEAALGVIPE